MRSFFSNRSIASMIHVYVMVKIKIQSNLKFAQSKLKFQFCLVKIEIVYS